MFLRFKDVREKMRARDSFFISKRKKSKGTHHIEVTRSNRLSTQLELN